MAILNIITGANNPFLRKKAEKISKFGKDLKKFAKDMKETMVKKDGLGLAAPQVGKSIRMISVTLGYGTKTAKVVTMINPEILDFSVNILIAEEGCLSLPGQYLQVERSSGVKVKFMDLEGTQQILALEGLDARVVQHEVDHLDGILFIDRVKVKKGEMIM